MSTNAKQRFDETIIRCDTLLDVAHNSSEMSLKDDILRYTIVLAVSALDMYAGDRFGENFVSVLKSHSPNKADIQFLEKIHVGMIDVLELLRETPKHPYRRFRTLVDEYLSHNSMQSLMKIDDLYAYYGLPKITKQACEKAKRKNLYKVIGKLLRRRNQIVHGCDYNGLNVVQGISETEVRRWIKSLKLLIENIEVILIKRFPQRQVNNSTQKS